MEPDPGLTPLFLAPFRAEELFFKWTESRPDFCCRFANFVLNAKNQQILVMTGEMDSSLHGCDEVCCSRPLDGHSGDSR